MKYFLLTIILFLSFSLFSQSENDLCENAIEINTLSTSVDVFEMSNLTFDLTNGTCAIEMEAGNFWFKFESHGAYFKFTPVIGNEISQLSLFQFENGDCILDNAIEIACAESVLEVFNLVDGEYYFISMSTVPALNQM